MLYSIVIPCYNEAENIPLLLERFSQVLKGHTDIEVVLVDNGSTDRTAAILDELLPQYPFAVRAAVAVNQGYGHAILTGLRAARGDFLGWTHADLQTDPLDVVRAVNILKKAEHPKRTYVKGTRKGRPKTDTFFTFGMSVLELGLTGKWLNDINAQPNLFSRAFFNKWQDPPKDFSLDLYAFYMAKLYGLTVVRFPVRFPERIHGSSKWNTDMRAKWRFIKRTADYSFRLTRKGVK